ncbi:MAG: MgtC/SapB family protein [Planctomycetota bacterium]
MRVVVDSETIPSFQQMGVSLALGLLIGLQRQFARSAIAGLRTFSIVAVLGTLAAWIDQSAGASGWVIGGASVSLAILIAVATFAQMQRNADVGITTEAALLLTFALGAYVAYGDFVVALSIGGAIAVLLQFKPELHGFVGRLGADDLRAIMTFVLITCVVLPVVPNRTFGPFAVLNPFQIWLMVTLIVGVGLCGYLGYKLLGASAGVLLGGVLGGAISSTATTLSYSRGVRAAPERAMVSAVIIAIACAVVYARVLGEIAVIAPRSFRELAPPIAVVFASAVLAPITIWLRFRKSANTMPPQSNPAELKAALVFALLYALVLLALAACRQYFNESGLYVIAVLSGLTDMDAITISTARMVEEDAEHLRLTSQTGWRLILIASTSNLLFKTAIIGVIGGWPLLRRTLALFFVPLVATLLVMWLWP